MMQLKFLLFSSVCCGLLQVILCGGPDLPKLPPSAMFRPIFSSRSSSSISSASTSSSLTEDDLREKLNQSTEVSAGPSTPKPEDSAVVPSSQPKSAVAETLVEDEPSEDETPAKGTSLKRSPSKKKLARSASKKNTSPNDPLNIADLNELKERAKVVIRNLLKDENANRAISLLVINARDLLENKVSSNMILTHTHLIRDTLMNEEAKDIIKDFRLDVARTFMNEETPKKVETAFQKSKECLSREDLPKLLHKRFKTLKKILKNDKTYSAMVSLKHSIIKFVKTPDVQERIAEAFKLLDFGIHFDPNNVMSSLGLPISFFK